MGPKIVRTAIYSVTTFIVLLVLLKNRNDGTSVTSSKSPVDPLKAAPHNPDKYNAEADFHNIINQEPYNPVVIFSKSYCPHSMRAKRILLEQHNLTPAPVIVELDRHPHGQELQAEMQKVTGRRTVPNVIVGKVSRGGGDDMAALQDSGTLKSKFEEWGQGYLKVD